MLALFLVLAAAAASLFWITDEALAVVSTGDGEAPKSLFGLVSRWV